jgi:predicted nucleic acid-binding protein
MIVADTNLIAYHFINGPFTDAAQKVALKDGVWVAPPIWHHEFMNVIATVLRQNLIDESTAIDALTDAEGFVRDSDHERSWDAIKLSVSTKVGVYDCEFVVLAQRLAVPLVTADKAFLKAFPETAISIEAFASGS